MASRWTLLLLCGALAACGGGGGDKKPPPDADADQVTDAQDCAPNDASRWQLLTYQSVDADADGRRRNDTGQTCSGASLPANYFASAVSGSEQDCNDTDASSWTLLAYVARDADADGFATASAGNVCSGNSLPTGYLDATPAALTADCDDASATIWRLMTTYQDHDGDGVGSGKGTTTCLGAAAAAGSSLYGYDPIDDASDPSSPLTASSDLPSWLLIP